MTAAFWACRDCDAHGTTTGTESGADKRHADAEQHCTTTALTEDVAARIGGGVA